MLNEEGFKSYLRVIAAAQLVCVLCDNKVSKYSINIVLRICENLKLG